MPPSLLSIHVLPRVFLCIGCVLVALGDGHLRVSRFEACAADAAAQR